MIATTTPTIFLNRTTRLFPIRCTQQSGRAGEKAIGEGAIDIRDGGTAIPYDEEDPFIRAEYEETLKREGVTSRMADSLFRRK